MKSQIFKFGGGAGIGSYIIVIENGTLKPVRSEVVRGSYDNGENLYLSIIDDSTEEALLPLSGYVDNEGILHLSGRDFDDNKTYEFTVNNAEQTISVEEKEGVTIGETTIPTSGGSEVPTFEASTFDFNPPAGTFNLELAEEDIADIIANGYPIIKISYTVNDNTIIWPFILSTSQASVSVVYISVVSAMNIRFLLDFALQAGQIVSTGAGMINTSNIADIKVDNTSVVDQAGNVNLVTKTAYDPATNKLVTEADVGGGGGFNANVLDQLVWTHDNNKTQILFPENVLPLRFSPYNYYVCYFKYYDKIIYDGDNPTSTTGLGSITIENNRVKLSFTKSSGTNFGPDSSDTLDYILVDGNLWNRASEFKNTYSLYEPTTGGSGTKLYKHHCVVDGEDLWMITTDSEAYDETHFNSIQIMGRDYISAYDSTNENTIVLSVRYDSSNDKMTWEYVGGTHYDIDASGGLSDTVTSL